jgi:hypothetical protein
MLSYSAFLSDIAEPPFSSPALGPVAASEPPALEPAQPDRITIENAIKVFLTNREGAQIASPTLRKYRALVARLQMRPAAFV